jgi:hypothetical protein
LLHNSFFSSSSNRKINSRIKLILHNLNQRVVDKLIILKCQKTQME